MTNSTNNRDKLFSIRLNPLEFEQLQKLAHKSTCRSLSDYARRAVLGQPIIRRTHNDSLAEFLKQIAPLNTSLNKAITVMTDTIKHLHLLRDTTAIQQWIMHNEQDKSQLVKEILAIKELVNKSYKLWSQE